jgi:hypothetical protein
LPISSLSPSPAESQGNCPMQCHSGCKSYSGFVSEHEEFKQVMLQNYQESQEKRAAIAQYFV